MIDELNHLNRNQVLNELSQRVITSGNEASSKEVMLALSKIQLGDMISGKLILEDNQTMLKLENGLKLLAHLSNGKLSDQLLDFLVVGKKGQHLELEQVQIGSTHNHQVLHEVVMKELQLPNTDEMKQMVGQWMGQELSLIKNQMLQLYHLSKNYNIPTEALTQLKAQDIPLVEQEMKLMHQFKAEGIQLIDQIIQKSFEGLGHKEAIKLNIGFMEKFEPNLLEKALDSFQDSMIKVGNLKQEDVAKLDLIKTLLKSNSNQISEHTIIQNGKAIEQVLQSVSKEALKELSNHLIHKYLMIHHKEVLDDPQEIYKVHEEAKRIRDVIKNVEQHINQENIKEPLQTLEQMANALEKYNSQGQYYCFPLQIKEHQTSGELYFFKPKKQKKSGQNGQGMYIVLALDMPSLKHIEVHLEEKKEQLELKIKVANTQILKQIEAHKEKLNVLMDETMMPIGDIKIEVIKESIVKKVPQSKETLSRMDFRI